MEDLAYRLLFSQSKTYQYCRKILEVLQMAEKVQREHDLWQLQRTFITNLLMEKHFN